MEAALIIYLISVAGAMKAVFGFAVGAIAILYFAVVMFRAMEGLKPLLPKLKLTFWAIIVGILLAVALPDKKTSYMMAAGYFTQQAVQSDHAKELSKAILKKLEEYSD